MALIRQVVANVLMYTISILVNALVMLVHLVKRFKVGPSYFEVKPRPTPPAILNDPKWGTHNYVTLKAQGVKLHYVAAGDPTRPLLLCVHGFPECWFSWRHQLAELSKKYWVVAVDMRGYGDSDKPPHKSSYAIDTLVEDLRQLVGALGKEKCILMAHDWGAVLAWYLVIRFPQLFTHHISLNGPHRGAFYRHLTRSPRQLLRSWYIFFFQMPFVPELTIRVQDLEVFDKQYRFEPEVVEAFKYYFSQDGALTPPINYYRNSNFGEEPPKFPKVKVPTLIIWGVNDMALGKEIAALSALECENARVSYVADATHWVQQDQPEHVNKLVLEFLDG